MPALEPSTTDAQRISVDAPKLPIVAQRLRDVLRLLEEVENDRQRNYALCDALVENLNLSKDVSERRLAEVLIGRLVRSDFMDQAEALLTETLEEVGWPLNAHPLHGTDAAL